MSYTGLLATVGLNRGFIPCPCRLSSPLAFTIDKIFIVVKGWAQEVVSCRHRFSLRYRLWIIYVTPHDNLSIVLVRYVMVALSLILWLSPLLTTVDSLVVSAFNYSRSSGCRELLQLILWLSLVCVCMVCMVFSGCLMYIWALIEYLSCIIIPPL